MDKILNVGDYVVETSLGGTVITQIYRIDKVTAKTAQCGKTRFHRVIKYSSSVDVYGGGVLGYYYRLISDIEEFSKSEMYKKYIISKVRNRMQESFSNIIPTKVLKEVSEALNIDTLWK